MLPAFISATQASNYAESPCHMRMRPERRATVDAPLHLKQFQTGRMGNPVSYLEWFEVWPCRCTGTFNLELEGEQPEINHVVEVLLGFPTWLFGASWRGNWMIVIFWDPQGSKIQLSDSKYSKNLLRVTTHRTQQKMATYKRWVSLQRLAHQRAVVFSGLCKQLLVTEVVSKAGFTIFGSSSLVQGCLESLLWCDTFLFKNTCSRAETCVKWSV